jgi:hypothetical protein
MVNIGGLTDFFRYHRIMNAMNQIILDLNSKSMMDRRFQSSLSRRHYKVRQRQDYPKKAQNLYTIERSTQAVENLKVAAMEYRDFCGGMVGNTMRTTGQANGAIKALAAAKKAFKKAEADFIDMAQEMIDVNERFCSFKDAPTRHEKPGWKVLRRAVKECKLNVQVDVNEWVSM